MDCKSDDAEESNARKRVEEILKLFRATCCKLIQDEKYTRRIDMEAYNILKKNINFVNLSCHQFGNIPGVNVGDRFKYRIELKLVGLHRPPRNGIDYMKVNEQSLATSIVDSGGYENQVGSKKLIYMGQGGNVAYKKKPSEDQKLTRGNIALKNSIYAKNPVRVIRTFKSHTVRPNLMGENFIYDGLYMVREYWQELGSNGFRVYKFRLVRMDDQSGNSWIKLKKF
nr:histone-lysine n-methyltransferase, h3 lysine-9 specific suvh6 [Quercus suber]